MFSTSEYWQHTFVIDLKLPKFTHQDVPNCTCPELVSVVKHLSSIHNETYINANNIIQNILLSTQQAIATPPKSKRSLLPFIGKIASGLFGVSTTDDIRNVANNVNHIHKEQDRLKAIFNHEFSRLSSFMATSNDRLNNAVSEILANHDLITGMQANFQTFAETLAQKQSWIFTKVIDQTYTYNVILNNFQNLQNGFITLRQGHLSPLLISNKDFMSVINMIKYVIRSNNPQFQLLHSDPSYYYNFANFAFHRSNYALLITVQFPISSVQQPFTLFEIIHYPLPLHKNSNHTTTIPNLPKYIAISGDKFVSLPQEALADCNHHKNFIDCTANLPLQNKTNPDCSMALLDSNKQSVKQSCDFVLSPNSLTPAFRQLNQTTFLAIASASIHLQCKEKKHILPPCTFCLVQIPCNCNIQTDHYVLPQRISDCQSQVSITTAHPVNLILLQHFFDEQKTINILPNTTYPAPLNITLTKFQFFDHKFKHMVVKDEKINLKLRQMVKFAKEDQTIYQNLAEAISDNPVPDFTNTTMLAISCVLSVCSLVVALLLFIKYRKMVAMLLLYRSVPQTAAVTLPSFHYNNIGPTQPPTSSFTHFHSHFQEFNEYIVFTLAILVCIYFIYKHVKPFTRPVLYLEISNGKCCAFCPLRYLPTCVRNLTSVTTSSMPSIKLKTGLRSKLHIAWNGLIIGLSGTDAPIHLPTTITLNPLVAFSIHKILQDEEPYQINLWAAHNQFCIPIDIATNLGPSAPVESNENSTLLYPNLSQ